MNKKIANFIRMAEELRAYGEFIQRIASEDDWDEFCEELGEVERMTEHAKICIKIFEGLGA